MVALLASPARVCGDDTHEDWVETYYPELATEPPPPPAPATVTPASEGLTDEVPPSTQEDPSPEVESAQPTSVEDPQVAVREMETLVRRARNGLIGMSAVTVLGGVMLGSAAAISKNNQDDAYAGLGAAVFGGSFAVLGAGGMITSGIVLGVRKKRLRALQASEHPTPRNTLEDLELRKRRAAFGLIAPAAVVAAGIPPLAVGIRGCRNEFGQVGGDKRCENLRIAGLSLVVTGFFGLVAESILVGVRKNQVTRRRAHSSHGQTRRAQWDVARSQLVF
jgi:hypothetical protein